MPCDPHHDPRAEKTGRKQRNGAHLRVMEILRQNPLIAAETVRKASLSNLPYHEVEALARVLLPEIQAFFESEEGQREYRRVESKAPGRTREQDITKAGTSITMLPPLQFLL